MKTTEQSKGKPAGKLLNMSKRAAEKSRSPKRTAVRDKKHEAGDSLITRKTTSVNGFKQRKGKDGNSPKQQPALTSKDIPEPSACSDVQKNGLLELSEDAKTKKMAGLPATNVKTGDSGEVGRIIEETKEREARIQQRLELLREQAKMAVAKCKNDDVAEDEENKDIVDKLAQYENEMATFKSTMDNILHVTKETHSEIQRTKDLMVNIQGDTSQGRLGGSFQSKFVEDDDVDIFKGSQLKSMEFERTGMRSVQSPIITTNDEDGIKYVITNDDVLEGGDDVQNQVFDLREKMRFFEQKVLQTESERLQKEKENLQLKESISKLKRQLIDKDKELKKNPPPTPGARTNCATCGFYGSGISGGCVIM